jgi:glucose-1-phosphatase
MFAAILALCGTSLQAQTKRSDAFHAKYELKEVVVMSRHNIRSPLSSAGAAYMRVTPHKWFKWTSPGSQLSLRGGVLETEMGQFFRKWVVSEGLLPDNYRPKGDEVLFYANSRQRTLATAKYFSAGFLPFANVEITHKLEEDKMDPVFTPQFTKMNDAYRQQVLKEIEALNGGPQAWMAAQQPTLKLMEEVLDMAHSPAALEGDTTHFWYDDIQFKLEKGDEPKMTGGYKLANSVADAMVLQCYETESMSAFGHKLTTEQWRDICGVKEVYDGLLFTTHAAAVNLAYPLVSRIREELQRQDRKFMFLCGHDSNLASIGAALGFVFPETERALELHTPIGSKLVFEKWSDGTDDYVAINLVYQTVDQLQGRTLLSTDVPPMVMPVTVKGLVANSDGLYPLGDLDARFAEAMSEYDAIVDDEAQQEAGNIIQVSLGGWHSPDYTAEQIISRIDTVSQLIPVKKVIIGWSQDKESYRQVGAYLHNKGIRMLLWLPVFAETEDVCENSPAVDLWGKVPANYDLAAGEGFRFNCPSDPKNTANVVAIYDRLFSDCGFDGVFLDRIRTQSFVGGVSGVLGCGCPLCVERFAAEGVDIQRVKSEYEALGDAFFSVSSYTPKEGFSFESPVAAAFFKAKGHVVSASVAAVADSLRSRGLEVGMDLYAPFMAPFVGQDYTILANHADFIKPMLYRQTFAPAGMGFEYNLLRKAAPAAKGYPDLKMDADFLHSQLEAMEPYPCGKYPGIEINYRKVVVPTSPEYVSESLKAVLGHNFNGAVLSWNIMEAPLSHLEPLKR